MTAYRLPEFVKRYLEVRSQHGDWTNQFIANEMNMTRSALDKALERARNKGYVIPPLKGKVTPREAPPMSPRMSLSIAVKDVRVDPTWKRRAPCRFAGMDEDFIPDGRIRAMAASVQNIKNEYCALCPVQPECLVEGLKDPALIGIWGGVLIPHELNTVDVDKLKAEINERG